MDHGSPSQLAPLDGEQAQVLTGRVNFNQGAGPAAEILGEVAGQVDVCFGGVDP